MLAVWEPRLSSCISWPAEVSKILMRVPCKKQRCAQTSARGTKTFSARMTAWDFNTDQFPSSIARPFLLSPTQSLSVFPGDLVRCSTALPHGQECQLEVSLCWLGPRSARGLSGSRGKRAESCCYWDTARRDLERTKAQELAVMM